MKRKLIALSAPVAQLFISATNVSAIDAPPEGNSGTVTITQQTGGSVGGIVTFITQVGGWLLYGAGALSVVVLIWGGIQYMASAGNADKAAAAKKTIIYALIGVVVIALSLVLINIVTDLFKTPAEG